MLEEPPRTRAGPIGRDAAREGAKLAKGGAKGKGSARHGIAAVRPIPAPYPFDSATSDDPARGWIFAPSWRALLLGARPLVRSAGCRRASASAEWLEWAGVVGRSPEGRGESGGEEDQGQGGDEHGRPRAGGTSGWGVGFVSQGRLPDLRGGGLVLRIGMIHRRFGDFVRLGRVVGSQWSVVSEDGEVAFGRGRGGRSALNQSRGGRFVRRVLLDRGNFGRADGGLGRPGPDTSTRVAHSRGYLGGRLGVGRVGRRGGFVSRGRLRDIGDAGIDLRARSVRDGPGIGASGHGRWRGGAAFHVPGRRPVDGRLLRAPGRSCRGSTFAAELQQGVERPLHRPTATEMVPPQQFILGARVGDHPLPPLHRTGLPPRLVLPRQLGQAPDRPLDHPQQRRPRLARALRQALHQLQRHPAAILRLHPLGELRVQRHLPLLVDFLVAAQLQLRDAHEESGLPIILPMLGRQVQRLSPREPDGLDELVLVPVGAPLHRARSPAQRSSSQAHPSAVDSRRSTSGRRGAEPSAGGAGWSG